MPYDSADRAGREAARFGVRRAAKALDEDEKGTSIIGTLSGDQENADRQRAHALVSARSPPVGSRKAHLDPVEPALRYGSPYGFPTLGLGANQAAFWRVRSALRTLPVRDHRETFNFAAVHPSCHYAFLLGWPISS